MVRALLSAVVRPGGSAPGPRPNSRRGAYRADQHGPALMDARWPALCLGRSPDAQVPRRPDGWRPSAAWCCANRAPRSPPDGLLGGPPVPKVDLPVTAA